ncbi:MAG: hypothetical protein RL410_986 [Actinomycetota bacterium]
MKRQLILRAIRLLKALRVIPSYFTLEDVAALRLNTLSRAVVAPDATAEADLPENKSRLKNLLSALSAHDQELATHVRTVLRANRFDEYQLIFNELVMINGLIGGNFSLRGLARERYVSVLIKTALRFGAREVVEYQLSKLAAADEKWMQSKLAIFDATQNSPDEAAFLNATRSNADGVNARVRRAAYLQTQNRDYASVLGDLAHPEIAIIRHNAAVLAGKPDGSLNDLYRHYGLIPLHLSPNFVPNVMNLEYESATPVPSDSKVSVIFPVRNCSSTIEAALQSIYKQSHTNIEVIVVDDDSTDNTVEIAKKVSTRFPQISTVIIQNHCSAGPFVSRNRGIAVATGEYITFNDGDDISHPQRLEIHVRNLNSNPNLMFETSRSMRLQRDGIVAFQPWHPTVFLHLGGPTFIARREMFSKTGVFDSVRFDGDFEFSRRVDRLVGIHAGRQIPLPLYILDLADQNLTTHGPGALDFYRRNDERNRYHSFILNVYDTIDNPRDLVLDGVKRLNHGDYSAFALHVSAETVANAVGN